MVFKCKMCGGDLDIEERSSVGTCQYCATKQTLPKLDDDKRKNLYERANHHRRQNEFDKAAAIYESILNEDRSDAEAYWSLVLCKYGVEYVQDPASGKRVPTCHRTQFGAVQADEDYKQALAHADAGQKALYEEEAAAIDGIQKGILAISSHEDPFDIFICYKETDEQGKRTLDSKLAQDLHHELTEAGFKVFFSRITLEGVIGSAYEPHIFAALQSAKAMIVVGTKPEHFNAVWVKNEWSRYLALIRGGAKKTLIPAYRDMDPYSIPEELSHLQAQDMGKLGFMQDLVRGIKKVVGISAPAHAPQTAAPAAAAGPSEASLLKRIAMFTSDGDWKSADEYCSKLLDINPDCVQGYFFKVVVDFYIGNRNLKPYVQRLESACPEPTDEEKAFINERNCVNFCFALIGCGAASRVKYIASRFPERVFSCNIQNDKNPTMSILSNTIIYHSDKPKCIAALLESGADVNSFRVYRNQHGDTRYGVLGDAIWNAKSVEIARMLIERGADANGAEDVIFDNGNTGKKSMLAYAILDAKSPELVDLLLQHGADPRSVRFFRNAHGATNYSALSDAITPANNPQIVRLLLEKGADPNVVEDIVFDDGTLGKKSMLTYAILDAKSPEIVDLLLQHGAKWDSKIRIFKKTAKERNFPYPRHTALSKDFIKFLKKRGWRGALLPKPVARLIAVVVIGGLIYAAVSPSLNQPADAQKVSAVKKSEKAGKLSAEEKRIEAEIAEAKKQEEAEKAKFQKEEAARLAAEKKLREAKEKERTAKYPAAEALLAAGKYPEAMAALKEIGGYQFGKYRWRILEVKDGKALLITEDVVGDRKFNEKDALVTWETSTLRKYLNGEFYDQFGAAEKDRIVQTKVSNPSYAGVGGKATKDMVFLLSQEEAAQYFKDFPADKEPKKGFSFKSMEESARYFKEHGDRVALDTDGQLSGWWLRTPGLIPQAQSSSKGYASIVEWSRGKIEPRGKDVDFSFGVRPAMWIKLK